MTSNCCRLCFSPRAIASSRLSGSAPGVGRSATMPAGNCGIFGTGACGRFAFSCAPADAASTKQAIDPAHTHILNKLLTNDSVIFLRLESFVPPQVANSSAPKLQKIRYLGHQ